MRWLWLLAALLVALGSLLALAESSLTRMTRVRALSLQEDGHRNAGILVRMESDPPRYLNSVYLAVMIVQNGSAILVAFLAQRAFAPPTAVGEASATESNTLAITLISVVFTLLYFVVVEAMSKTFGVLHSDRVALFLAPFVFMLGRMLAAPTRLLIGLANVLLSGKGLRQGPFVSENEIRSMAEVGSEEGSIEEGEKELIHSIFAFGDTIVREVMVPRPDVVAIEDDKTLRDVQALVVTHGYSRIPVYHDDLDDVLGFVFAKDVLKSLHQGKVDLPLRDIVREAHVVPVSKKVADLLREMQRERFHIALVTDEYGSVTGIVSLEDLLEELVGEIADEYDREDAEFERVGERVYRVSGKTPIDDVNELLDVQLPDEEWDTVAGLVLDIMGRVPHEGDECRFDGLTFRAERVLGRRIETVLITRDEVLEPEPAS